jgi:3-oxoacyl-(acyl-carrier-protein) synthase
VKVEGPDSEGEGETGLDDEEDEDYGEEYDDTRTFTVKDFKEQALRYAREHYQTKMEKTDYLAHNTSSHALTPAEQSAYKH